MLNMEVAEEIAAKRVARLKEIIESLNKGGQTPIVAGVLFSILNRDETATLPNGDTISAEAVDLAPQATVYGVMRVEAYVGATGEENLSRAEITAASGPQAFYDGFTADEVFWMLENALSGLQQQAEIAHAEAHASTATKQ